MLKVFITGGTGSVGRALVSHLETESWISGCTVYSRDEVKQGEMRRLFPEVKYILGDVRDEDWMAIGMRGHDIVIHAGAYKQIPAAEVNTAEAIETNVWGSRAVARAAVRAGVSRVVGISTDKACAPINTYGQSKALMEKLFSQAALWGDTQFCCVRYGNVLGSRGSVVPLFREQGKTGIITITDPTMTRFWLTLPMAVDIVLRACTETERGVILIPKCKASDMRTLAKAVAPEAGIKVIGTRPGEKKNEQLIHSSEALHTDDIGDMFRVWPAYMGKAGNLPESFEFTSDKAKQLTVEELRAWVGDE